MTQPAISHHLSLMKLSGVVVVERDGKHNIYRVCEDVIDEATSLLASKPAKIVPVPVRLITGGGTKPLKAKAPAKTPAKAKAKAPAKPVFRSGKPSKPKKSGKPLKAKAPVEAKAPESPAESA